ncbi:MAG: DUF6468 domain-containing protein [Asticcacaulis sp.]
MSVAGIIMDVLLMGLLLTALWFGMRLNARLKALKAGQEGFAKAVAELDSAAIKAFTSLKDLRTDADESQELLHGRILAARDLIQKLEVQIERAERAQAGFQSRPEPVSQERPRGSVRDVNDRFHNPTEAESDVSDVGLAAIGEMLRNFARTDPPSQTPAPSVEPRAESLRPAANPSRRQPYPGEDDLFDTGLSRPRRPVASSDAAPPREAAPRDLPVEPVVEASNASPATPSSPASMFRRYR